jgi:hypothetical protein
MLLGIVFDGKEKYQHCQRCCEMTGNDYILCHACWQLLMFHRIEILENKDKSCKITGCEICKFTKQLKDQQRFLMNVEDVDHRKDKSSFPFYDKLYDSRQQFGDLCPKVKVTSATALKIVSLKIKEKKQEEKQEEKRKEKKEKSIIKFIELDKTVKMIKEKLEEKKETIVDKVVVDENEIIIKKKKKRRIIEDDDD